MKAKRHSERETVVEEYSRLARIYDSKWAFYIEATTRETVARLPAGPIDSVLDVGCGTGALLGQLARRYPQMRLIGIDPVPEMLAAARRHLPLSVDLHKGWAERLPYDDASFDVVVSCSMLHYIRQPITALQEMSRVVRPGGRIVITDWCGDYVTCRICDWYLRLLNPAHFKVYRRRECLQLFRDAGYPQAHIERYKVGWIWGLMTLSVTREAI